MVDTALTSVFYASNVKEIRPQVVSLLDSLSIHLTLISLAHYNNQDESKIASLLQMNAFHVTPTTTPQPVRKMSVSSNTTIKTQLDNIAQLQQQQQQQQQQTDVQKQNNSLDFFILIDSLFNVLCNDDMEYWPIAQRTILIIIETSEIFSSGSHFNAGYQASDEAAQTFRPNLINLALFDYLAEKICHLCYERSWYAKKAGYRILLFIFNRLLDRCNFSIIKL